MDGWMILAVTCVVLFVFEVVTCLDEVSGVEWSAVLPAYEVLCAGSVL